MNLEKMSKSVSYRGGVTGYDPCSKTVGDQPRFIVSKQKLVKFLFTQQNHQKSQNSASSLSPGFHQKSQNSASSLSPGFH